MADVINNQEVISCNKISSTSHLQEINASCKWTIYNFRFLTEYDDYVDASYFEIKSPTFLSYCGGNFQWNVNIAWKNMDNDDYLDIFILIPNYKSYPVIKAKISILNDKGKPAYAIVISDFQHRTKFIQRKDLFDRTKRLLVNNKLVLLCEVKACSRIEEVDVDINDKTCTNEIYKNRVGITKDFETLIQGKFSDIMFAVNQNIFHLHKCILAARSQVFSAMFGCNTLEKTNNTVVINDTSHEVFKIMVEFIYSGHVKDINNFPNEFLLQLLAAADKYELAGLKDMCEFICLKRLSVNNAVEMLKFSDFYNVDGLKSQVMKYIVAYQQDLINDSGFESLSKTHLHLLPQLIDKKINWTNEADNEDENQCSQHKNMMICPIAEKKYWSVSQVNTGHWSHTWVIKDFKANLSKNWETICTQTFNSDDFTWKLTLSQKNEFPEDKDDILSLHVEFSIADDTVDTIKAQYDISVINLKQEKFNCIKSDVVSLYKDEPLRMKRLKKSFLLSNARELLPNDILTIECNMKFGLSNYNNFGQSKSINDCPYKHLLQFSSDLEHFLTGGQLSDITLIIGEKKFLVHRTILALRSPCLLATISQQLLQNKEQTVELVDVKPEVFQELLSYIYSGKINNLKDFSKDLYVEAEKYEISKLKCICEAYLCNNLTVDNVCDVFVFAHVYKNMNLRDTAALYIVGQLDEIVNTPGFLSVKESRPQLLKEIISKFHM